MHRLRPLASFILRHEIRRRIASGELPPQAALVFDDGDAWAALEGEVADHAAASTDGADLLAGHGGLSGGGKILQWISAHWQTIYAFLAAILAMFGITLPPIPLPPAPPSPVPPKPGPPKPGIES